MTNPEDWKLDQGELLEAGLLLYVEPESMAADEPVIDELTGKMTSAFRLAESNGKRWRGWHTCRCGAHSDNTDYILPSGHQTNSLAIHYVALHRDEIPPEQLDLIGAYEYKPVEPTQEELQQPQRMRFINLPPEALR